MNDLDKLTKKLQLLISEKEFAGYIVLFQTALKNAPTEEAVNNLFTLFFKLEFEHKVYLNLEYSEQYKELLQLIRELLLQLFGLGIIPDRSYLYLYLFFKRYSFEKDQRITDLLNFFKEDIVTLSWDSPEKITENNIIFLLEILNGNNKEGLTQYIRNLLITNIYTAQNVFTITFIEEFEDAVDDFDINIIIDAVKFYLNLEEYQKLSLNEKKSLFAWAQQLLVNDGSFAKNTQSKQLYLLLKDIVDYHIKNGEIEELMYVDFFAMMSQATISQHSKDDAKFNEQITYPCAKAYQKFTSEQNLLQVTEYKNTKKKIAFVFERLISHSPFKVVFSLLKRLQENKEFTEKFEIAVYSLNYFAPEPTNTSAVEKHLLDIGIEVVNTAETYSLHDHYSNRVQRAIKIRNKFIENKIDIMIACCNSYDILNFLFVSRTAPTQIFWSHNKGNYDVPGIDKRIAHFEQNENKFDFNIFNLPLDMEKYNPKVDISIVQKTRKLYPEDAFILGNIGRLIKIDDDEYLKTVAQIMKKNPHTIYLACGSGNEENIKKRIKKLGIEDRFYFTGHIDPHIYGHLIDLYLDPFPFGSGASLTEYVCKGNIFIKLYSFSEEEKNSKSFDTLLKYIWVKDVENYIEAANKLINDDNLRESLKKPLLDLYKEFYKNNDQTFLKYLSS